MLKCNQQLLMVMSIPCLDLLGKVNEDGKANDKWYALNLPTHQAGMAESPS